MNQEAFCHDCTTEMDIEIDGRIVDIEDVMILCADCDYYREIQKEENKAEFRKVTIELGKKTVELWDGFGEPEKADAFLKAYNLTRADLND